MSDSAQDHGAHDHSKVYFNVLVGLAVLTFLTVAISRVHFGRLGNISVGLLIAVIKASLVVLFFMHLKYEQRWWAGIVLFPLLLVMIIIGSNLPDTGLNGPDTMLNDPNRSDLISPADAVIKHAGKAEPAPAHH
jgi:cytochrome c oxidase subunit 4